MKLDEIELVEVELKYCERCGGLWLRCKGSVRIYCATCQPLMAQFPNPRIQTVQPSPSAIVDDLKAWAGDYVIFCTEGHA